MQLLFIHQNFPGQFKHLAPSLVKTGRWQARALALKAKEPGNWQGVDIFPYRIARGSTAGIHPWVAEFETKTIRAEAAFRAAQAMHASGYRPDLILAHPGWGEAMFLKDVWPKARLGVYCEFYYHARGVDVGFDPEFASQDEAEVCRLKLKNLNNLMHFDVADAGLAPTHWQASTFPQPFRDRISVVHDGIDTDALCPNPAVSLTLGGRLTLTRDDEVITFVNRNLEPYRGYHIFMRALPALLRRRPNAQVLIVGGDGVSYGGNPPQGKTWKQIFFEEVRGQIPLNDLERVHFLGNLPYQHFIPLLQLSTVHVYLTYPFVLSWSLLEAMSVGAAIVASNTAPVVEAIRHGDTGRLVDFFDIHGLVDEVCGLLDAPDERIRLGRNAREFARATYDLKRICLPKQLEWIQKMVDRE